MENNKIIHIWETHGVHVGTMGGPVKHGVDNIEKVIELAIERDFPSVTFIIHTPRLTKFRYPAELNTKIQFIRGDRAYFEYTSFILAFREKYKEQIEIRFGVELEWQGAGLGLQWSRSKLLQATGIDFVIGSVHFSHEFIPYDDSKAETNRLIEKRGGLEKMWEGYLDEVLDMIYIIGGKLNVIGHLDLPKLYSDLPEAFNDLDNPKGPLAVKLVTVLEMIKDRNLALDVNVAGLVKGCGIYPTLPILQKAKELEIPIALGTDDHSGSNLGSYYKDLINHVEEAGYKSYVSFNKLIPEHRPLSYNNKEASKFEQLNTMVNTLNQRYTENCRHASPKFSFGGEFKSLSSYFSEDGSLGTWNALRARRGKRSLTFSNGPLVKEEEFFDCIYFKHTDLPGTLSLFFSVLASEEINIETAYLGQRSDGLKEAFFTVSGDREKTLAAIEFAKGTAPNLFIDIELKSHTKVQIENIQSPYIQEIDGVSLPIKLSDQMIISIHKNTPGVLLTILAGLASRDCNIQDLRLGKRGNYGYAIMGLTGDKERIAGSVISRLGREFVEVSLISNGKRN